MHSYTSESSWVIVVAGIILIGATYLVPKYQPTTMRPFATEKEAVRPPLPGRVQARLWQDPLEVGWKRIVTNFTESGNKKKLWKEWMDAPQYLKSQIQIEQESVFYLPIVVSGKAYPELREKRLRSRFALQEAMEAMKFRPKNHDTLSYFPLPLPSKRQDASDLGDKLPAKEGDIRISIKKTQSVESYQSAVEEYDFFPVTYEFFNYTGEDPNQKNRQVVVFWIDDLIINRGKTPNYLNLEELANYMAPNMKKEVVLTLSGSDELRNLIKTGDVDVLPEKMLVNYAMSTAPKMQFNSSSLSNDAPLKLKEIEEKIVRTIPSDNYVLAAIVDELQRRITGFGGGNQNGRKQEGDGGEDKVKDQKKGGGENKVEDQNEGRGENKDNVWLLTEQDTFYSQVMTDEFKNIARERSLDINVSKIGFLKGIDGNLPDESATVKSESSKPMSNLADLIRMFNQSGVYEQRLFDRRQIDYLQRIAEDLLQSERKKPFHQRVKAIGILGGDVYDKMLILEVFRHSFPATNYFTTDLDSSYLYGPNAKVARNLIIGSAFGLSPEKIRISDEKKVLIDNSQVIFRDSYQTALYHTVLRLISPENQKKRFDQAFKKEFKIKLYEVGKSRFHLLPTDIAKTGRYSWNYPLNFGKEPKISIEKDEKFGCLETKRTNVGPLLSPPTKCDLPFSEKPFSMLKSAASYMGPFLRPFMFPLFVTIASVINLLLVWCGFMLFRYVIQNKNDYMSSLFSRPKSFFLTSVIPIIILIGLLFFLLNVKKDYDPMHFLEPIFLFEGISAWPSILLRGFIFIGGVLILITSLAQGEKSIIQLQKELKGRWMIDKNSIHPDARVHSSANWLNNNHLHIIVAKILTLVFLLMLLVNVLFRISSNYSDSFFTPGRGRWVFLIHEITLVLSLSTLLLLVLWAAFRHFRCRAFLVLLTDELRETRYREETRHTKTGPLSISEISALEEYAGVSSVTLLPPFAMMVLMVVSRNSMFDGWNIPLVFIIFLSVMLVILLVSAFHLSSAARRLKLDELNYYKINAEPDPKKQKAAKVAIVWESAAGPFGKYQQQPVIQALIFAAAGFGISFIEPMFRFFSM